MKLAIRGDVTALIDGHTDDELAELMNIWWAVR